MTSEEFLDVALSDYTLSLDSIREKVSCLGGVKK